MNYLRHTVLENNFLLTGSRCLFWVEEKTLVLSDMHLGKSGHFRKHGIAIPQTMFKEDLQRFTHLLQYFKPDQIIIVGDLFHSYENREMDYFLKWRQDFSNVIIKLVIGNHDILDRDWYSKAAIECCEQHLQIDSFLFTHDLADVQEVPDQFVFSGHIHPAVAIKGVGKQHLKFPCFYFSRFYAILPAYGNFTGTYTIKPKRGDVVFALLENRIMQL